jgi:hypothetical protein
MEKLSINNEMRQLDSKNRDFYDELTVEEKKKFSNYLMIRWGSSVDGGRDMQEYYLQSCNHHLNKHFFAINKHPKLQWLCATTISPGPEILGRNLPRHSWISTKKKEGSSSSMRKQLADLFPNMKNNDLDLLAQITTKQELEQYQRDLGIDV